MDGNGYTSNQFHELDNSTGPILLLRSPSLSIPSCVMFHDREHKLNVIGTELRSFAIVVSDLFIIACIVSYPLFRMNCVGQTIQFSLSFVLHCSN